MRPFWKFWSLILLTVVMTAGLLLQRQINMELRGTIGMFREQNQSVTRLQRERARLVKLQVSARELENLRADHAAIARLKDEIEAGKARLVEIERAESASAPSD